MATVTTGSTGQTAATKTGSSSGVAAATGSPAAQAAIEAILADLAARQAALTGVRPARDGGAATMESWLKRVADSRGRGAYYPYIGSGLGRGALVELVDGSVKWDMICGIGVHAFGHGDAAIVRAGLEAATSDLCMQGNLQFNGDSIQFAELLLAEAGRTSRLRHCFLSNSGCMVNESALKICQQKTGGAPRVLAFDDCFMGRSTAMTQIGDGPDYRQGVALNALVDYLPFYDAALGEASTQATLRSLRKFLARYPKQHGALVMELIQGEGGFNMAPRSFFTAICETARSAGVPVWLDEVQTFGRTERMFHYEALGLGELVDVVTIGKLPQACALLFTEAMNPRAGLLSGTFTASTSAFRAGLAALTRLRDGGFYGPDGSNARLHAAFRTHVDALMKRHGAWFPPALDGEGRAIASLVGGTGGMMRFTPFGGNKEKVQKALHTMFANGVIAFSCGHGPYHIRFLPPIGVMKPQEFDPVFEIVERSLAEVA